MGRTLQVITNTQGTWRNARKGHIEVAENQNELRVENIINPFRKAAGPNNIIR